MITRSYTHFLRFIKYLKWNNFNEIKLQNLLQIYYHLLIFLFDHFYSCGVSFFFGVEGVPLFVLLPNLLGGFLVSVSTLVTDVEAVPLGVIVLTPLFGVTMLGVPNMPTETLFGLYAFELGVLPYSVFILSSFILSFTSRWSS